MNPHTEEKKYSLTKEQMGRLCEDSVAHYLADIPYPDFSPYEVKPTEQEVRMSVKELKELLRLKSILCIESMNSNHSFARNEENIGECEDPDHSQYLTPAEGKHIPGTPMQGEERAMLSEALKNSAKPERTIGKTGIKPETSLTESCCCDQLDCKHCYPEGKVEHIVHLPNLTMEQVVGKPEPWGDRKTDEEKTPAQVIKQLLDAAYSKKVLTDYDIILIMQKVAKIEYATQLQPKIEWPSEEKVVNEVDSTYDVHHYDIKKVYGVVKMLINNPAKTTETK